MESYQIYLLAIGANLTFSTASMVFSVYSRKFSPMWITQVKVVTAFIAFVIAMLLTQQMVSISAMSVTLLLLSGFAGLCFGDIFLFRAYAVLGAGRSLVLFSFEPLILGIYGYFFLNQLFTLNQTLAVFCMVICIGIFMLERNRTTGNWDVQSFIWAFIGIALDSFGIMLTRTAYDLNPDLGTFQVNVIRCLGAMIGFLLLGPKNYLVVGRELFALRKREISLVLGAAFTGCFLSLTLYLAALKFAHVGTLTAISITGPVWVSMLECIYNRRLPNFYLVSAFTFFLVGFYLMLN